MWIKSIIVDASVKVMRQRGIQFVDACRQFKYAFSGFDADKNPTWTSDASRVKLYDSVNDCVSDARLLNVDAAVNVYTYHINPQATTVSITHVKF